MSTEQTVSPVQSPDRNLYEAIQEAGARMRFEGGRQVAVYADGSRETRYQVQYMDDPAPEGATLVTTLQQFPPEQPYTKTLRDVVRQVFRNLPPGVELSPKVYVKHYPISAPSYVGGEREGARIFAYYFFTKDDRNIAHWIPDTDVGGGALMYSGFDGRGRIWGVERPSRVVDIGPYLRPLEIPCLGVPPALCRSTDAMNGWRKAEELLRSGYAEPDDHELPIFPSDDYRGGYVARMNAEAQRRAMQQVENAPAEVRPKKAKSQDSGMSP